MKRLLALALGLLAFAPAAAGRAVSPSRAAAFDGIALRPRARKVRRGSSRRAAKRATAARAAKRIAATPLPAVTEIDAEGLKRLLQRDADPAKARPLLVNFWATWCDPCRKEFPDLVKVDADYRNRGLDFAVVSGDDVSEIGRGVPKFLREMRAAMPAYLLNTADTEAAINSVDATWGGDLPATFLFDRDGKIVFKHFGQIDPAQLRAALDRVLDGQ